MHRLIARLCVASLVAGVAACDGSIDTGPDASATDANGTHDPTADELLAAVTPCDQISADLYSTSSGEPPTVAVCGIGGGVAVAWTADLAIDCDGQVSVQCNLSTDPDFQNQTATTDSNGLPLDAAALPYVVVPSPSATWDYGTADLHLGDVFAVIYNGQVAYGVFGDTGPTGEIGEGSYALAVALGIDPDPSTGGADSGVTFIGFTGTDSEVDPIEDPDAAATLGLARARALVGQ